MLELNMSKFECTYSIHIRTLESNPKAVTSKTSAHWSQGPP